MEGCGVRKVMSNDKLPLSIKRASLRRGRDEIVCLEVS